MKKSDIALFILWMTLPLMIILSPFFLTSCTPTEITLTEEIAEEVLEKDLESSTKSTYHKNTSIVQEKN